MKKFVIFLISATLLASSVNLSAQTEKNQTTGCQFRFVLVSPLGTGWTPSFGLNITVDDIDYGTLKLPWGTPSSEETLILPSGEVNFSWVAGFLGGPEHYFEIYNALEELIYTSPDFHPTGLLFTYQNECNVGISNYTASLQLYPNPANSIVNISGDNIVNVKVFNNIGQLINYLP